MIIVRRSVAVLAALIGLLLTAGGVVVLWLDGRLSTASAVAAEVVLAGSRVTDLDLPVGDRVVHLQALTVGDAAGIGSALSVQRITSPVEVTRLVADTRWPMAGWTLVAAGILVLVLLLAGLRWRRRSGPVVAALLVATLTLSGCMWTGDHVDRVAYRQARAELTAAFPALTTGTPLTAVDPARLANRPVTDPEDAARVVLDLAGLSADDAAALVSARWITQQLLDRQVLCRPADADPAVFAPLLELFVPGAAAQIAGQLPDGGLRSAACDALGPDVVIRSAVAVTASRIPDAQESSRIVRLSVVAGYQVTTQDGRTLPWSIEVEAGVGTLDSAPGTAVYLDTGSVGEGPGEGAVLFRPPTSGSAWPAESWPDGGWLRSETPHPGEPDADTAAAVVQALAELMDQEAVELTLVRTWTGAGEDGEVQASGVLQPATGSASVVGTGSAGFQVRVLDRSDQFSAATPAAGAEEAWSEYDTSRSPALGEWPTTNNPYAALDWVRRLSSASSVPCPDGVVADSCAAAVVPTLAALEPGTPGYREAVVAARHGAAQRSFLVGWRGTRLSALQIVDVEDGADGAVSRITSTWTFGATVPASTVVRPSGA